MKRLPEDKIILQAQKAAEKREGSLRRTTALMRKTQAERELASQRQAELANLRTSREARHARLLSERELRRERVRPYYEAAKKVVSVPWKALKYLESIQQPARPAQVRTYPRTITRSQAVRHTPSKALDISIDLGKIELL